MFGKCFVCFHVTGIFFSVTSFFLFVIAFLPGATAVYGLATIIVIKRFPNISGTLFVLFSVTNTKNAAMKILRKHFRKSVGSVPVNFPLPEKLFQRPTFYK